MVFISVFDQEKYFGTIIDNLNIGINIIDSQGIFVYYNETMARIEGLEVDEVLGKFILDVYPGVDHDNSTLLNCLRTGEPVHQRMQRYLNKRGEEIFCIITNIPIVEGKDIKGVIEFAVDMNTVGKLYRTFEKWYNSTELKGSVSQNEKHKYDLSYYTFDDYLTQDSNLISSIEKVKNMAMYDYDVLIYGETGTGKEIIAQSIHNASSRNDKPFIAQNCAAIPENLLESMFFGTEKGSFTGALSRPGLFEQANGGTLLLDELNSLPMYLQAKLLRVLQEGYVTRLGSSETKKVDVRVLATVNENPIMLIANNRLREDLFYRLGPIYISIPPLRERKDDIKYLCNHFIKQESFKLNRSVPEISDEVMKFLLKYHWKGNVRELKNAIKYMMINLGSENTIEMKHLPYYMVGKVKRVNHYENIIKDDDLPYEEKVDQFEKSLIKSTLEKTNGNISEASRVLKIKRSTLQYKVQKFKIDE